MISSSEANSFFTEVLKFKNWKEILEKDKLEFLRTLVPYYAHHTYFQNISMSSTPPEDRCVPKEDDIIAAGLSGTGGACITQNAFLSILLKSIGFNSYVVSGFVHGPRNLPDNHVMCVVEFPEEKYVLDLGVALPLAGPVPMHDLPYTQKAGGFRYRYKQAREDDKDLYYRLQLDGALYGGNFKDPSTEFPRYEFTMTPRTVEFFHEPLQIVFKNIEDSIFLQHPFLFRYFEEDDDGNVLDQPNIDGDRKWILIRGVSVLIGTDETRKVTHYSTYDDMKDVILKYFPKFRKEDVEKSIQYFNETVPSHGYFKAK